MTNHSVVRGKPEKRRCFRFLGCVLSGVFLVLAGVACGPKAALVPVDVNTHYDNYSPGLGERNAAVTIEQYSDFECAQCKDTAVMLRRIVARYPREVRIVFRHFPLEQHKLARAASRAVNAAGRQSRFWDMHDAIFNRQSELSDELFVEMAQELSLNLFVFMDDLMNRSNDWLINQDIQRGESIGVMGTPALVINGKLFQGMQQESFIESIIQSELKSRGIITPVIR